MPKTRWQKLWDKRYCEPIDWLALDALAPRLTRRGDKRPGWEREKAKAGIWKAKAKRAREATEKAAERRRAERRAKGHKAPGEARKLILGACGKWSTSRQAAEASGVDRCSAKRQVSYAHELGFLDRRQHADWKPKAYPDVGRLPRYEYRITKAGRAELRRLLRGGGPKKRAPKRGAELGGSRRVWRLVQQVERHVSDH